jgi:hypothetical protein
MDNFNEKDLVSIREASEMLDISIDTLRRWDENGKLASVRSTPTGHRFYSKKVIDIYLSDLLKMATDWISSGTEFPEHFYCANSSVLQSRLSRMQNELEKVNDEEIKKIFPLVVAVTGEIGNNSFDHNLGNWPDIPGIFLGYDLNKKQVVLADRGQGILETLKRVRPGIIDDKEALRVAFTDIVSGRAPEERGNGLKFVRQVVTESLLGLSFQSGNAVLELRKDKPLLDIKNSNNYYRGCIAFITF